MSIKRGGEDILGHDLQQQLQTFLDSFGPSTAAKTWRPLVRVMSQLKERRSAWVVPQTKEDLCEVLEKLEKQCNSFPKDMKTAINRLHDFAHDKGPRGFQFLSETDAKAFEDWLRSSGKAHGQSIPQTISSAYSTIGGVLSRLARPYRILSLDEVLQLYDEYEECFGLAFSDRSYVSPEAKLNQLLEFARLKTQETEKKTKASTAGATKNEAGLIEMVDLVNDEPAVDLSPMKPDVKDGFCKYLRTEKNKLHGITTEAVMAAVKGMLRKMILELGKDVVPKCGEAILGMWSTYRNLGATLYTTEDDATIWDLFITYIHRQILSDAAPNAFGGTASKRIKLEGAPTSA